MGEAETCGYESQLAFITLSNDLTYGTIHGGAHPEYNTSLLNVAVTTMILDPRT